MMSTALVIDGAYFLRRLQQRYPGLDPNNASHVAVGILFLADAHLAMRYGGPGPELIRDSDGVVMSFTSHWIERPELYRIFFYDCPPLQKRAHTPIGRKSINLAETDVAKARLALHDHLVWIRKIALRLGRLNDKFGWRPTQDAIQRWTAGGVQFRPTDNDFEIDTVQKGVDMRLGLDVASMAFKRQVDQIILIASGADFVPAVKLARREGIDVVLDPMGGSPARDLIAHVDGVRNIQRGPRR